jgi:fumarate reductase subunit C
MERSAYVAFIARELSSVFVAWSLVYLLMLVRAASQDATRYQQFLDWSAGRAVLALNAISLLFVVFHAVTWFNLAPQAMVVRWQGKRVPGAWIARSNYAAWAMVSIVVACVAGAPPTSSGYRMILLAAVGAAVAAWGILQG